MQVWFAAGRSGLPRGSLRTRNSGLSAQRIPANKTGGESSVTKPQVILSFSPQSTSSAFIRAWNRPRLHYVWAGDRPFMFWLCYSRPSASARTWGRDLVFVATGGPAGGAGWERTLPSSVPYSSSLPLLKPSVILIASLHNAVISSSDGSVYLCLSIYISTVRRAIAFLSHPMPHIAAITASTINTHIICLFLLDDLYLRVVQSTRKGV